MILWLILACLTAGVAAGLLPVAVRARTPGARAQPVTGEEEAPSLQVYREQLAQLSREVERGAIAESEAAAFRSEIGRRLIKAADQPAGVATGLSPWGRAAVASALLIVLPLAALGLYLGLGQPDLPDRPYAARGPERAAAAEQEARRVEFAKLVEQLERRMKDNPDDPRGWALLGRSLTELGRYQESADAYGQAILHGASLPEVHAARGVALTQAEDGAVGASAAAEFKSALADDPKQPQARFYLGLARLQSGDIKGALEDWRALRADGPADAPWQPMLADHIAAAARELGVDPDAP